MRFVLNRAIILYLFLLHAGTAAAQQRPSLGAFLKEERIFSFRSSKGFVPMLLHNFGRQAVSPLHLNEQSFLILAGAGGETAALYYYDEDIDAWIRPWRDRHPFLRDFSPHFTQLGDYYGYALVAGYGLTAMALRDHRHFRTAILASLAAITAGVWVRVVKVLTGRMRPLATPAFTSIPARRRLSDAEPERRKEGLLVSRRFGPLIRIIGGVVSSGTVAA